ncbi:MAG: copper-translocating P-type ATPase [Chloroflexi bacterium CFX7]|nr:copper-translocating P-type ATPase [Chloroflexi bacterium CFX7]
MSFLFTIPVILYSELGETIFGEMPPAPFGLSMEWMGFILATPVVLYGGWVFILGTYYALRSLRLDMSVLIFTGVAAAYLYSVGVTFTGGGEVFYEAAAMLITFVLFGHWMEMRSRRGTTDALRALLTLVPERALVVRDGQDIEVDTAEVVPGDRVRIRPGQRVPVDGMVLEGRSSIDESLVTGESLPVERREGDQVVAGSVNGDGLLLIEAVGTGSETVLGRIIELVQNAQASKAPAQRIADRAAAVLVVVAVSSGLLTFALWMLLDGDTTTALRFAIAAVVIACPDALGLATPTAVAVATGLGAQHKILIKDAATLERVSAVNAIVLDKTGTITEGKPQVVEIAPTSGWSERELLRYAAALEQSSTHPLAQAVVNATHPLGLHELPAFLDAENVPGYGAKGVVEGKRVLVGNLDLLRREGVAVGALGAEADRVASAGRTVVAVAVGGEPAGVIALADVVRASAAGTVRAFQKQGIEVALLTGDNEGTGRAVAAQVGIDRVFANVKPGEKADYVRKLQAEGKVVAMVGDGVNDAPALAAADVGIAIGAGTDVAIETASVVLMRSDPVDILKAIDLSKATMRKMKQNLFWASIYNVLAIPLAAGIIYNSTGFQIRPEIAALLMSVSSIIVATNAVLLRRQGQHMDEVERDVVVQERAHLREANA